MKKYFLALAGVLLINSPVLASTQAVTRTVTVDCPTIANCISISSPGDTIFIPSGTYTESVTIGITLTLQGANPLTTILRAQPNDRGITHTAGNLSMNNLTITGGNVTGLGGGIMTTDTLTLNRVIVSGNKASTNGGGIQNTGWATFTNSIIRGNSAIDGGGIYSQGGLYLYNSQIDQNSATHWAGGIYNFGTGASAVISNVTISNNSAANNYGGALNYYGTFNATNVTFEGNRAAYAGGMGNRLASAYLTHATFSHNSGGTTGSSIGTIYLTNSLSGNNTGGDCGVQTTVSNTWIADGSCGSISGDPKLGPLANYGGPLTASGEPIYTMRLLPSSGAIDTAPCLGSVTTDARGVARPQDGNADSVSGCDFGAYERQAGDFGRVFVPNALRQTTANW